MKIALVLIAALLCSCASAPAKKGASHVNAALLENTRIINTAIAGLTAQPALALLQGHVAINISSGSTDLDAQFGQALQNAFPNFTSGAETVHNEDLYQMAVKVYRENDGAVVYTYVTNFQQRKIVERTVNIQNVAGAVLETLQYKTVAMARNEFEAYLNSAFHDVGAVVENAVVLSTAMVPVQGGTFTMGSDIFNDEDPVHRVTLSGFYMGKYEVTQKEWREVMGNNPSHFKGDNLPVEQVSWDDAVAYCNKRSAKEGLTPAYTRSGAAVTWNRQANGYRLPTEAEWEYACRAGTTGPYYSGNSIDAAGWYDGNSGSKTHPVGQKQANAWGLYDMHGNVLEWCWDWYASSYGSGLQINPTGPSSGSARVVRGGSWAAGARLVRSASRHYGPWEGRNIDIGFRLVRGL